MFRCPISGERLIKARAGGNTIFYSSSTDGRMLTLAVARQFFGENKTREIWMRSEKVAPTSENGCPSCQKSMRLTPVPDWVGAAPVEVCRACRVLWFEGSTYREIPLGSQLINPYGDSTLVRDLGEAYLEHSKSKLDQENTLAQIPAPAPDSAVDRALTFIGLPVEKSQKPKPEWPVISAIVLTAMILIHFFATDGDLIQEFGFYSSDLFRNGGLNILLSPFLHGGWFHLIGNCYLAYILSDDVEEDLGWQRFIGFLLFVIVGGAMIESLIEPASRGTIPSVGFSGVVMGLLAYYGFQFPKAKLVWVLPRARVREYDRMHTPTFGWGWFQFNVLWVALFYFFADLIYFYFTRNGSPGVSYSGHIGGFVAGYAFWKLFATKIYHRNERDVFTDYMDRLIPQVAKGSPSKEVKKLGPDKNPN